MRNQQNVKVRVNSSFETICPFPIGYVYMSSNSTSPGSIYGGTWASISGGRYMRAAGAWGNGGSNTITVQQMPNHRHIVDYTFASWSGSSSGYTIQVTNTANGAWSAGVSYEGGGNRSTQPTKMFGCGTELPKEGERLCVTFNKFKSALRVASRKFVHSPLVTFICQPIARVQQALTVVRGHLLQTVDSCGQAVRGIQQAAKARILLLHKKCHHTLTVFGILLVNQTLPKELSLMLQVGLDRVGAERIWMLLVATLHTITFHPTAPAIAGIAPLKVGEC